MSRQPPWVYLAGRGWPEGGRGGPQVRSVLRLATDTRHPAVSPFRVAEWVVLDEFVLLRHSLSLPRTRRGAWGEPR